MSTPGQQIYRECAKALKARTRKEGSDKEPALCLSDADKVELRRFFRRHQRSTDRLARIWPGGSKGKFEHAQAHYLDAFPTRVCAAVRSLAKAESRPTLQDIYVFAAGLDVWQPLSELVLVWFQPKPKGGFRDITKHGPRRMAQQFIVRDLLTAVGVDNEWDYARPGAGGEKFMMREVCQRIEEGYRDWQTADIKECFASLKPGHLKWLPLPEQLLRNVVFLPRCARIRVATHPGGLTADGPGAKGGNPGGGHPPLPMEVVKTTRKRVRRGLPQGSVLSPLVARAFVGRELRAALGNTKVARCSFVDDLTLGARNRPEVDKALDALRTRLLGHPAGPIRLHVDPPTSTRTGRVLVFNYVLKPGRGHGDNYVHVHPGRVRFGRFHKKLYDRWKAAGKPGGAEALEPFILERLTYWIPSQQAWDVVPLHSSNLAFTSALMYIYDKELEGSAAEE